MHTELPTAVEYVPAGQAAQAASLRAALKVPGAQETHAPATRVSPAAQRDNGQIPRRLQSAAKPHSTELSRVSTTCMYPVVEMRGVAVAS